MIRSAVISDCGAFRYAPARSNGGRTLLFVMLNPSTADAEIDDPTIRRCIALGKANGFDSIEVVNLFAFRATRPIDLRRRGYPVGPENDRWIVSSVEHALESGGAVCCAWGANVAELERPSVVLPLMRQAGAEPMCFGFTRSGHPRHPLYLPANVQLVPFTIEAIEEAMHG